VRGRLFRPIENGQDHLALALLQEKDAGHAVFWRVAHQVERPRRAPQSDHIPESFVLDESHSVGIGTERGEIVPNFIHSSGNGG